MKKAIQVMALFAVLFVQSGAVAQAGPMFGNIIKTNQSKEAAVAAKPPVQPAPAPTPPAREPVIVEVQPGDTLTKIATAKSTTYVRIYDANPQVKHPDIINPGDKLRVPFADEQIPSRPLPTAPVITAVAKPASITRTTAKSVVPKPKAHPTNAPAVASGGVWDQLAKCESGGNWSINTGNGYYGGLQFSLRTWKGVGGSGYPHQASKEEQIMRAEMLLARSGWGQWPACTSKLGLR